MRSFGAAFGAKDDPARLQAYSTQTDFGCRAGYLGTAPFSDTVAQELLSSGKLNTISDPSLRAKIRDLTICAKPGQNEGGGVFRHRRPISTFVEGDRLRGLQLVRNVIERITKLRANARHRGNRGNGDEGGNQAVLDRGRTLSVTNQLKKLRHFWSP